jgi:hypothetical protein
VTNCLDEIYYFVTNFQLLPTALAQIEVESFLQLKTNFCCCKKATAGSSFCDLQKWFETRKLVTDSWIGL